MRRNKKEKKTSGQDRRNVVREESKVRKGRKTHDAKVTSKEEQN